MLAGSDIKSSRTIVKFVINTLPVFDRLYTRHVASLPITYDQGKAAGPDLYWDRWGCRCETILLGQIALPMMESCRHCVFIFLQNWLIPVALQPLWG